MVFWSVVLSIVLPLTPAESAALDAVPDARYARLTLGVNLVGWFSEGGDIPFTPIGPSDAQIMAESGLRHVRLPVDPRRLLALYTSPAAIAQTLAELDAAVDLLVGHGIAVVLELHAWPDYQAHLLGGPEAVAELVDLWRALAARHAARDPDLVFFEVMNEPDHRFTPEAWHAIQTQVVAAIRAEAPSHTVLVTSPPASTREGLMAMPLVGDPNAVYVFHFYDPFLFTQQGATWTSLDWIAALRDVPYPAYLAAAMVGTVPDPTGRAQVDQYISESWDGGKIDEVIGSVADWARTRGVRVVMNEFGVYKRSAPSDSRLRWLRDVRVSADRHGIAWTMWDYLADGFGLVVEEAGGSRHADPEVLAALGLRPGTVPDAPLEAFVGGLYEAALARPPAPSELSAWVQYLVANPTTAAASALVRAFLDGPEHRGRRETPATPAGFVTVLYRASLGRAPSASEVAGWASPLQDALDSPIPIFASSPEFHARVPDPRDRRAVEMLVAGLYEQALGRAPAAAERRAWAEYLAATADFAGAARAFFASAEYTGAPRTLGEHVTALYRAFLGRDPAPTEASAWIAHLESFRSELEELFLAGVEFDRRVQSLWLP
jgi:hypothetical protein